MWGSRGYRIIEVDKPRSTPLLDGGELRETLRGLQSHPAFKYLLDRLKSQRLALEARLKNTRFDRVEDISHIQSGIFWAGWLERELDKLTQAPEKPELTPSQQELEAFREIDTLLERIG